MQNRKICNFQKICVFLFRGASGASGIHLFSVISFIACTCPNRSGVGAIDNPGLLEQVFEQYDIPDVPEKNFEHDFSIVCRQKMFIFSLSTAFIRNFTYYNLYQRKLKLITRKKYVLPFSLRPLNFL